MMKYLIIGNGPAGTFAARMIRHYDPQGTITIISSEKNPFYSRPRLPEFIRGRSSLQDMVIFKSYWYKENRVELILEETVFRIFPEEKKIITTSGKYYQFDKLLIAAGSVPDHDMIPDDNRENIYTLHTIEDAAQIREKAESAESIAVIGSGLPGLETAYSLVKVSHAEVTLITHQEKPFSRQLDEEGTMMLWKLLKAERLHFEPGVSIKKISEQNRKKVIELTDSRIIEADFVLVNSGSKVRNEIMTGTGISYNKGILVNDYMETNIPDIFAAGDCAESVSNFPGHWMVATEQGRIAGTNMAGKMRVYKSSVPVYVLKTIDINLVSMGKIPGREEAGYEEYKILKEDQGIYKKLFFRQGILEGSILIGDVKRKEQVRNSIGKTVNAIEF